MTKAILLLVLATCGLSACANTAVPVTQVAAPTPEVAVVAQPTIIEQRTIVEKPIVVETRTVVVEKPVIVERHSVINRDVVVNLPASAPPTRRQSDAPQAATLPLPKGGTPPFVPASRGPASHVPTGAATAARPVKLPGKRAGGPININTASQAELESLPGIGKKRAAAMVAARGAKPFTSIDDAVQRRVVPASAAAKIKPLVTQ